ncbi:unnamed protein product [Protopolystoma xenopodis]|uniref:Uncharacterized protein n=1 Tax=Protopolystoma xenopodis TaxID=117903 RepID=A0A3S5ACE8_9PLAT|nr:unnamed protein product [Protopolystoma xenopodis]
MNSKMEIKYLPRVDLDKQPQHQLEADAQVSLAEYLEDGEPECRRGTLSSPRPTSAESELEKEQGQQIRDRFRLVSADNKSLSKRRRIIADLSLVIAMLGLSLAIADLELDCILAWTHKDAPTR